MRYFHVSNEVLAPGDLLRVESGWSKHEATSVFLAAAEDGRDQVAALLRAEWVDAVRSDGTRRMEIYAKEAIFEQIRRMEFPSAPARHRSAFLWRDTLDAVWFRNGHRSVDSVIAECEAEHGFEVDMSYFDESYLDIARPLLGQIGRAEDFARKYWSAEQSGAPRCEILHGGPVRVIRLVNPAESS